jgi:integrase/recombinase XerD
MIYLERLQHRGVDCISFSGSLKGEAFTIVNRHPQRMYSATHKCYYIPYTPEALGEITAALQKVTQVDCSRCVMEEVIAAPPVEVNLPPRYTETLIKLRYSEATLENYVVQFKLFLAFIAPKGADEITDEEIHRYLLYLVEERKVSISTQNQAINSIKFYLERVHGGERKVYTIGRPNQEWKLPTVLSVQEMQALFQQVKNLKHRCILFLLYSAGLRMSELLALRWEDIDALRGIITVRSGKGNKDRITLLSKVALTALEQYRELYRPEVLVFEGPAKDHYSARSVNNIIKLAATRAGIVKNVSAHTLRHSFATHLLESGTDLRYIQSLLGHESSRTTERYTHVTKRGFEQLRSPLDNMPVQGNLDSTTNKEI